MLEQIVTTKMFDKTFFATLNVNAKRTQIHGEYSFMRVLSKQKIYRIDDSSDYHYTLEIMNGGKSESKV